VTPSLHDSKTAGWLAVLLSSLVLLLAECAVARADGYEDPVGAIYAAAQNNGVDPAPLISLAWCESRFRPAARGDEGHSHGLMQLSDRDTGLLAHFKAVKYSDPYDPEQAADYTARTLAGDFAGQGITMARWSCWRRSGS
jgi:soluble lytic murein transglycosylase-like protein